MDMSTVSIKGTEESNDAVLEFMKEYSSIAMMLNVPIYALMSKLAFIAEKKYRYNYTEHLVIFMYLLAQLSFVGFVTTLIGAFSGLSLGTISFISIPIIFIYIGYCLKRILNLDWTNFLMRALIFICILIALIVLIAIVIGVIMYLNGDFQNMNEAQKAAAEASRAIKDSIN
jgi:hypothetical protein